MDVLYGADEPTIGARLASGGLQHVYRISVRKVLLFYDNSICQCYIIVGVFHTTLI